MVFAKMVKSAYKNNPLIKHLRILISIATQYQEFYFVYMVFYCTMLIVIYITVYVNEFYKNLIFIFNKILIYIAIILIATYIH